MTEWANVGYRTAFPINNFLDLLITIISTDPSARAYTRHRRVAARLYTGIFPGRRTSSLHRPRPLSDSSHQETLKHRVPKRKRRSTVGTAYRLVRSNWTPCTCQSLMPHAQTWPLVVLVASTIPPRLTSFPRFFSSSLDRAISGAIGLNGASICVGCPNVIPGFRCTLSTSIVSPSFEAATAGSGFEIAGLRCVEEP